MKMTWVSVVTLINHESLSQHSLSRMPNGVYILLVQEKEKNGQLFLVLIFVSCLAHVLFCCFITS